jgi:hypothetical protein
MKANFYPASANADFRVNGIEFRQGQLRSAGNDPTDFEIVIKHPFLGTFAVHEEFVFELCLDDGSGLRCAGFLQCAEAQYVLIDSANGWKIRLL